MYSYCMSILSVLSYYYVFYFKRLGGLVLLSPPSHSAYELVSDRSFNIECRTRTKKFSVIEIEPVSNILFNTELKFE